MAIPIKLVREAKTEFDLTEEADQQSLYALTEALLALPDISQTEVIKEARKEGVPLEFRIAAKLFDSRRFLQANDQPVKVGVIFAMWGEQNRLYPKSRNNPNGEDSLRVKLDQLAWVTRGTPIDWHLYAVDDGCPHDSGKISEQIASEHPLADKVSVLFLQDAIPAGEGPLSRLQSVDDSRKGGAVILGAIQAMEEGMDVIIYTDADNSVHLGQIGLLLRPHMEHNSRVVLGNRKHPDAVLVKQESRWGIGIKLLRHMQRMVGQPIFSRGILDTQAAFKLYQREMVLKIISDPTVFDFSFDTDWILASIACNEPMEMVPFAFVDSFAESASITQGPMTTWETLLLGLVKAVRKHDVPHNETMALVLEEEIRSSADLDILIHHLPPQLEAATEKDFGDPKVMSPEEVRAWIQQRKQEESA
jgi:hypothetical protein